MSLPTMNDITAVDPVLSNMLVGYKQDASRFVASRVFPVVPVGNKSGTYYIFTKKYWMIDGMEERAPGGQYARLDFGASTATYDTIQYAAANPIPDEIRAANQAPMDLEEAAVEFLGQKSLIRKERAFVSDFIKTSVWGNEDNDSTTDWDDFTSGDPVKDVLTAIRTISQETGVMPNTLAAGHIVHNALINHPDIIDRVKYVQLASINAVENAMASLFGLDRYIAAIASYNSANEGQTFSSAAIFDDDALICYVEPNPGVFKASAGYSFAWGGGGGDGVIIRTRDDENDTDLIKTKEQWDQKVVGSDLGYLYIGVV